ncbi:MAG: hypothetical protein GF313_13290 [Caldithrix sp.]|nr:hypothetical protein [Caldithrix sp.]
MRIGFGYAAEVVKEGNAVHLGGVPFYYLDNQNVIQGTDIVLHAVADALYGASALDELKNNPHQGFMQLSDLKTMERALHYAGYKVQNMDITLVSNYGDVQKPINKIHNNLIQTLFIKQEQLCLKTAQEPQRGHTNGNMILKCFTTVLIENR